MKWLTLEMIKAQCRIEKDFTLEDGLLCGYGEGAEGAILELCGRTYEDLIETYGKVPPQLVNASLLLVAQSYKEREPSSAQNLSVVPYGFDIMVKPFVKL